MQETCTGRYMHSVAIKPMNRFHSMKSLVLRTLLYEEPKYSVSYIKDCSSQKHGGENYIYN